MRPCPALPGVKVEEPDEEKALAMLRAIAPFLEKHHQVMISADALHDAVRLSRRYLPARQLPDKAVSVSTPPAHAWPSA